MLGKRLKTILDYIDPADHLADIGCDHGLLLVGAIKKGVGFVQGVDNKIGPLEQAKSNLAPYLTTQVKLSLSDGFDDLDSQIDTVVISGMGGLNIINIFTKNIEKAKRLKKIILQPNTNQYELRKYLSEQGFMIFDELIVYEKKQYYEILVVRYLGIDKVPSLTDKDLLFGPILRINRSPLFIKKWTKVLNQLEQAFNPSQPSEELRAKIELIKGELGGAKDES